MDPHEPPLTRREKIAADRALADLKREERLERESHQGFWRAKAMPALLWLLMVGLAIGGAHFWLIRPIQEANARKQSSQFLSSAWDFYHSGNLDAAASELQPYLEKPGISHQAHVLMARIRLAQGNRPLAVASLRRARETALNPLEIDQWILGLNSFTAPTSPAAGSSPSSENPPVPRTAPTP